MNDSTKDDTHSGELSEELKDRGAPGAAWRYVIRNQQTWDAEQPKPSAASCLHCSITLRELWHVSESSRMLLATRRTSSYERPAMWVKVWIGAGGVSGSVHRPLRADDLIMVLCSTIDELSCLVCSLIALCRLGRDVA